MQHYSYYSSAVVIMFVVCFTKDIIHFHIYSKKQRIKKNWHWYTYIADNFTILDGREKKRESTWKTEIFYIKLSKNKIYSPKHYHSINSIVSTEECCMNYCVVGFLSHIRSTHLYYFIWWSWCWCCYCCCSYTHILHLFIKLLGVTEMLLLLKCNSYLHF